MGGDLSQRLVPDGLWALVEPVLPSFRSRPQGGGTAPIDQRAVFTAVVCVLTSGCAWRYLPPTFGVPPATAHRRFSVWTASGVWRRLHHVILDEIGARTPQKAPMEDRESDLLALRVPPPDHPLRTKGQPLPRARHSHDLLQEAHQDHHVRHRLRCRPRRSRTPAGRARSGAVRRHQPHRCR
ncbi:transposase [Streptomyces sp. NPDC101490]|uniref:transposase n=1 Tax=Streptomyces sp. NPDC101490 TaxID=3366143 RepID=UPI0038130A61